MRFPLRFRSILLLACYVTQISCMLTKNNSDEQLQPALSNNSNFKIITSFTTKMQKYYCKNI